MTPHFIFVYEPLNDSFQIPNPKDPPYQLNLVWLSHFGILFNHIILKSLKNNYNLLVGLLQ